MKVSLEKAQEIVKSNFIFKDFEKLPLEDCIGKILANDVIATMNQPPFRRSAMDGYCIHKDDYMSVDDICHHQFKVKSEIDAGDTKKYTMEKDEAFRIMTGAKLPDEANWVIRQEDVILENDMVQFKTISSRNNICPIGEDFKKGDVLAKRNQKIDAYIISCATASGITHLDVYKPLKVAVITTGDELCQIGSTLKQGQIYNSNEAYLTTRLKQCHCQIVMNVHVQDNLEQIMETINEAYHFADYIITSGGVSVGEKDLMEEAMKKLNAQILFHGIELKPGMPTMYSLIRGVPILSLSGNPYSASSIFELLFPLLTPLKMLTELHNDYKKARKVPRIVRGYFNGLDVYIPDNQKNGVIQTGVGTNCLVYLNKGEEPLLKKSEVMISLL